MSILKALFITPYLLGNLVVLIYGILLATINQFYGLGYVLSAAPMLYMSMGNLIFHHSSTSNKLLPLPSLLLVLGAASSITIQILQSGLKLENIIINAILIATYALYLLWYSTYSRKNNEDLENGQQIPEFTVTDLEGREVGPKNFKDSPAIYLFYRGNWCPFCVTQIEGMVEAHKEIEKRGIKLAFISPQSYENSKDLADKYKIAAHFWVDEGNKASEKLKIIDKRGLPLGFEVLGYSPDTVFATIIMTNEDGIIFYNDQTDSYRVRPEASDLLRAYDEYKSTGKIQNSIAPKPRFAQIQTKLSTS